MVQQGRLVGGETIAVFGCGGVGLSAIMVAAAAGAGKIIAVDTNGDALAKALALGASEAIDASLGDEHVRSVVAELTHGALADVTVDAGGFVSTCENAVWCTRRAGRMVQVIAASTMWRVS